MRGRKRFRRRRSHVGRQLPICRLVRNGDLELECYEARNGRRMIVVHSPLRDDFGHLVVAVRRGRLHDIVCAEDPECEMFP